MWTRSQLSWKDGTEDGRAVKGEFFEGNEMGSGKEGFEVVDYGRRERRGKGR